MNYGFLVAENDANEYPITIKLNEEFPLYEIKKAIFKKETDLVKKFRISENLIESQVVDFFSYLRFCVFDGDIEILYKIISENQDLQYEDTTPSFYLVPPISEENEIRVLKKLKSLINECLMCYSTTLKEDLEIISRDLAESDKLILTNNEKNCILMRICEKKVLHFYLNFIDYSLELFKIDNEDVKYLLILL